jgi:hypothetical protein
MSKYFAGALQPRAERGEMASEVVSSTEALSSAE